MLARDALRVSLAEHGWARAVEAVPASVCVDLLRVAEAADWTVERGEGYALETAPLEAPELAAALGASGLRLVRHGPGNYGLPVLDDGGVGFVLDLVEGWPSQHGGLLMFEDGDKIRGWRPEPGALTLFDLKGPVILSVVTPRAGRRIAVLGRLAEA